MLTNTLLLIFYIVAPAGVLFICRKNKVFNKIGPVLTLYLLGVLVANIGILPTEETAYKKIFDFMESFSGALIPLALPMILFGCNFRKFSLGKSVGAFVIGAASVAAFVIAGYYIFRDNLGEEGPKMGAALTGQYLGGAANLAAIKQMLGLSADNFVILSTCNLIVSFFYLMFLMGGGITMARKIVHGKNIKEYNDSINTEDFVNDNPYKDFGTKKSLIQLLKVFGTAAAVAGVSLVVSNFFKKGTPMFDLLGGDFSMVALILGLTTISLILTSFKEVRSWDKSFDAGMYLIYIFCLAMAMLADLSQLDWKLGLWVLIYQAIIIFGSLALSVLLAKPFKVDADSAVITSDTLVNSPICVPMIAASMKNKDAIMVGITNGLAGYAVGNYLGYLIYQLLLML